MPELTKDFQSLPPNIKTWFVSRKKSTTSPSLPCNCWCEPGRGMAVDQAIEHAIKVLNE